MSMGPCASLRPPSGLTRASVCCLAPAHICDEAARCVSATAAAVLMLATGTTIHKSFLVLLFALQAPSSVISWITEGYGQWIAFLGLLLRLLHFIPGVLELPWLTILFVMTAPYQFMDLRESQDAAVLSTAIEVCLAVQHFIGVGSLRKAFGRESIVATLAIVIQRLMLAAGTTVDKYLLVPFFVLQAPSTGIDWIKGRDGVLIASVISLLMRLSYWFAPGELLLAVSAMVIVAIVTIPFQFITLRESQGRAILSLVIAAYLAFQHFAGAGGLRRAFRREAIVPTLCIICMTMITLVLVF